MKLKTGLPMREWINEVPNDGLIRYMMHGNIERVFLTSPKAIGEVLVQNSYDFVKPKLARDTLGKLLGFGVLLAEGEEHKFQRKHLLPAFAFRHIKDLYPVFWSKSAEMCQAVTKFIREEISKEGKDNGDGVVVDFGSWLNRATLDIIGIAGLGCDFESLKDPHNELNTAYRQVFTSSRQAQLLALMNFILPVWFVRLLPFKRNAEIADAAKKIRDVSRRVIVEKQSKLEKGPAADKDILSVALESGAFTVEGLIDNAMTFLAAGHETTATATQWALVELSKHPQIQQRLREEIRDKLPSIDEDARMTSEMVDHLPYLHAVCNEVLRFWAPVPFTRRQAIKDVVILGQYIPKGTDVVLVPYAINFSKALWGEDADQFNPERWMGEKTANNGGAESAYSNLTFLHGPRSCIGSGFAKAEFNCLLAAIVGRFEVCLEPKDKEIELQTGIVTRPKGGLKLRMKAVDGW